MKIVQKSGRGRIRIGRTYFENSRAGIADWVHSNVVDEQRLIQLNINACTTTSMAHVSLGG